MIRVLLADDHNLMRAGLRALLERVPDVEVVADVADGRAALAAVEALRPDLVFLDITMPGLNGLQAAAQLARDAPGTRVVILSMHSAEGYVAQALGAGVAGYVLKDAFSDELPVLIRAVMRGETYLSAGISRQVVDALRARMGEPAEALTPRQREILQLLAEGKKTREIAGLLDLSAKTVDAHRAQIMDRLGIHELAGLVKYAIRIGLIPG